MKIRIREIVILIFFSATVASGQQVIMGTNNYVEYQVGTLPIIISVPHGGDVQPPSIPDRMCNNPVSVTDAFTIETAIEIKNRLYAITGCYPHLIISHLKRTKLDPNRNLADGACGDSAAAIAWNEFHNFIAGARNTANQQYSNNTFFLDLHGHGHPIQRIELGYLLYDYELDLSDSILNTNQYIINSSIQNLVSSNINNYTHAQLLRGPLSFGSLLENYHFPSVPSQSIPAPGTTTNYFSGGYITANHTCYSPGVNINGLQMELNYLGIRDSSLNRMNFAIAFSEVIIQYMNTHFNMTWNSCAPLSTEEIALNTLPELYPNPVQSGELLHADYKSECKSDCIYQYTLTNSIGQNIKIGHLSKFENTIVTKGLHSGIYLIQISEQTSGVIIVKKIVVE